MPKNFFNDYDTFLPAKDVAAYHVPCLLLVDTSYSMDGDPIVSLNQNVNKLMQTLQKDEKAKDVVDICIVEFNSSARVVQNWRPISDMKPVEFVADGGTDFSAGLELALEKIHERSRYYEIDMGMRVYKPTCVVISDGYGGDISAVCEIYGKRLSEGKLRLEVLAVEGYDRDSLTLLTKNAEHPPFTLSPSNPYDFSHFFDHITRSIKVASTKTSDEDVVYIENPLKKEGTNLIIDKDVWSF